MTEESPALYVVPTPLGNLGDMTQRAIDVFDPRNGRLQEIYLRYFPVNLYGG